MALWAQLGLLLWKNFTYRRRQTVRSCHCFVFTKEPTLCFKNSITRPAQTVVVHCINTTTWAHICKTPIDLVGFYDPNWKVYIKEVSQYVLQRNKLCVGC